MFLSEANSLAEGESNIAKSPGALAQGKMMHTCIKDFLKRGRRGQGVLNNGISERELVRIQFCFLQVCVRLKLYSAWLEFNFYIESENFVKIFRNVKLLH